MHPYLPHLLGDIAAAERSEQPDNPVHPKSFEEEMEEVENWVAGEEAPHTFGYWCGLKAEDFVPAEQLTDKEMRQLCKAMEHLMFTWNLDISLPEKLPTHLRYRFIVNTLNEKTFIPASGFMGFDYCSGYAPDCVFKEYCACLEYWNDNSGKTGEQEIT
ncbi:MAG: hypothetical protein V4722_04170 [Bacteroidota bacterium]